MTDQDIIDGVGSSEAKRIHEIINASIWAAIRNALRPMIKAHVADCIAAQKRIARIVGMVPSAMKPSPMCKDPWNTRIQD
jgi:hypothetical protein